MNPFTWWPQLDSGSSWCLIQSHTHSHTWWPPQSLANLWLSVAILDTSTLLWPFFTTICKCNWIICAWYNCRPLSPAWNLVLCDLLQFHSMLTICRQTPTFSHTNPQCHHDIIMTSLTPLWPHPHLWHHYDIIDSTMTSPLEHYKYASMSLK